MADKKIPDTGGPAKLATVATVGRRKPPPPERIVRGNGSSSPRIYPAPVDPFVLGDWMPAPEAVLAVRGDLTSRAYPNLSYHDATAKLRERAAAGLLRAMAERQVCKITGSRDSVHDNSLVDHRLFSGFGINVSGWPSGNFSTSVNYFGLWIITGLHFERAAVLALSPVQVAPKRNAGAPKKDREAVAVVVIAQLQKLGAAKLKGVMNADVEDLLKKAYLANGQSAGLAKGEATAVLRRARETMPK